MLWDNKIIDAIGRYFHGGRGEEWWLGRGEVSRHAACQISWHS